jgi:inosine-uridine nucleoside N-ribohydrolase
MKHVILDTDIGGDADDCFALLFALNSPEISLDLIVTDDEHKGHRAMFAEQFLERMKRQVPVVSGIDLGNSKYCCIEDLLYLMPRVDDDCLRRIASVVSQYHRTEYVCIGPQSNLAMFMEEYPSFGGKVNITMMGGGLEKYRCRDIAEYNVRKDVAAARKVFLSDWNKRYVLGDTTNNPAIEIKEFSEMYWCLSVDERDYVGYLFSSMKAFFEKSSHKSTLMHDPLTVSTVFDDFVEFDNRHVTMDDKGIMHTDPDGKETMVSVAADYQGFWRMFCKRILS